MLPTYNNRSIRRPRNFNDALFNYLAPDVQVRCSRRYLARAPLKAWMPKARQVEPVEGGTPPYVARQCKVSRVTAAPDSLVVESAQDLP